MEFWKKAETCRGFKVCKCSPGGEWYAGVNTNNASSKKDWILRILAYFGSSDLNSVSGYCIFYGEWSGCVWDQCNGKKKILGFGIQLYHCHSVTPCSSSSATVVHTAVGYLAPALHLEPALPLRRFASRRPPQPRDLASRNPSEKDRSPPDLPM